MKYKKIIQSLPGIFLIVVTALIVISSDSPLHPNVVYAGTHGNTTFDSNCSKIAITQGENPVCPNPTQQNTTVTAYSGSATITSKDGLFHSVTFRAYTNDCADTNGIPCSDNNTLDSQTVSLDRTHPYTVNYTQRTTLQPGTACGSYQNDLYIDAIDGNSTVDNKCVLTGSVASTYCQTGKTCSLGVCGGAGQYTCSTVAPPLQGQIIYQENTAGTACGIAATLANKPLGSAVYCCSNHAKDIGSCGGSGQFVCTEDTACAAPSANNQYTDYVPHTACGNGATKDGYNRNTPTYCVCSPASTCPKYTISGNIFSDANGTQKYNNPPDTLIKNPSIITIKDDTGAVVQTISTSTGSYTSNQLLGGTYTVSYTGLPAGYYQTYPLSGSPPTSTISIGYVCDTNGANDAVCTNGNMTGVDFGVTNATSWFQSVCGDVRQNVGITNPIPPAASCGPYTGSYMIQQAANTCSTPGIAFSGNTNANFGSSNGQASADPYNWIVGSTTYPEVIKAGTTSHTSYAYLSAKMRQSGLTAVDLATKCTLSNCTLPANLPHGLYKANGNVVLQGYAFPAAQDYVFLINGTLTLMGDISVPVGSTVTFSTANNITVDKTVGTAATTITSNLDGVYSSDKSFIVNSTGACPDERLNIAGSVIVNASLTGGSFINNRNLCAANTQCPSVSISQRPDLILGAPAFLTYANHIWQEVVPGSVKIVTPTPTKPAGPTSTLTPTNSPYLAEDTFQKSNQTEWGTASDGQVWGGDANAITNFSIASNKGIEANNPSGVSYTGILGPKTLNASVLVTATMNTYSGNPNFGPVVRYTDANNWYKAYIDGGTFYIQKSVSGTKTNIVQTGFAATGGTSYSIRLQIVGSALNARVWPSSQSEPSTWTLTTTDSSLAATGNVGIRVLSPGASLSVSLFQAQAL